MATTTAKNPEDEKQELTVAHGASGGFAPEGTGVIELIRGTAPLKEGVATRSDEENKKMHKDAEEFQQSKVKSAEMVDKAKQTGDNSDIRKAQDKQNKAREEKAAKKPTAAGINTDLENPAVAQPLEATEKQEAKDLGLDKEENNAKNSKK
jgi:hypothetical protein